MIGHMLSYSGTSNFRTLVQTGIKSNNYNKLTLNEDNYLHNINGPAYIDYNDNGEISSEEYFFKGFRHRVYGPSCIWYRERKVYFVSWHYHGISYHKEVLKWLENNDIMWYDMENHHYNMLWMELL